MPSSHGPMLIRFHWLVCGLLALSPMNAPASAGSNGREARSDNGHWYVRVERGDGRERPATATLRQSAVREPEKTVWTAKLVNRRAPEHIFVSNDGAHVITFDEYRFGGALHAIVLYDGHDGKLRAEWSLGDLFTRDDWKHADISPRRIEWLRRSESKFVDADTAFEIRLRWGRTIRIDLKTGQMLDLPADAGPDAMPREVAELLADVERLDRLGSTSSQPSDAADAAPIDPLLAMQIAQEAAEALCDEHPSLLDAERLLREQILAAALLPEVESELSGQDRAASEGAASIAETGATEPAGASGRPMPSLADVATLGANQLARSQAVAATGITVPAPDPAHPVDYVAWTREITAGGEEARATMNRAISLFNRPEEMPAAFDRALSGDVEALNDPAVIAYRQANAAALAEFRAFAHQAYRGPDINSADGSMIGILLPHLSAMRQLATLATVEAHALSNEGRFNEAAALLNDSLLAGANIGQGPTMIEGLVGTAIQTRASEALLDITARLERSEGVDFTQAADSLAALQATPRPLAETLQFERAMMLDTLQRSFEYDPETQKHVPQVGEMLKLTGEVQGDNGGPNAQDMLQLATLDFGQATTAANAFYDEVTLATSLPYSQRDAIRAHQDAAMKLVESNPFVRQLAPVTDRARFIQTRGEAQRRAAVLVQQLQAHRQRNGGYPTDLQAFGDASFATDPFSGVPFRYERREDGTFRLYAVGNDLTDQGGNHDPSGENGDIVYWPRPPKTP